MEIIEDTKERVFVMLTRDEFELMEKDKIIPPYEGFNK